MKKISAIEVQEVVTVMLAIGFGTNQSGLKNNTPLNKQFTYLSAGTPEQAEVPGVITFRDSQLQDARANILHRLKLDWQEFAILPFESPELVIQKVSEKLKSQNRLQAAPYDASHITIYAEGWVFASMQEIIMIFDEKEGAYFCYSTQPTTIETLKDLFENAFVTEGIEEKDTRLYVRTKEAFGQALRHGAYCMPDPELLNQLIIKPSPSGSAITIEGAREGENVTDLFNKIALWDVPAGAVFERPTHIAITALAGGKFRGAGEILEKAGLARS